jgi:surface polysaccharide O-acyltransferase-like enzyme
MRNIVYYLGIAALFTHELDAVLNLEWRLLYHLRTLPDVTASSFFIGLHLPAFFLFFYLGHHPNKKISERFRVVVAAFLVIHSVLHFRLSDFEDYQFQGFASNFYIYGAALMGAVYLFLTLKRKKVANAI